MKAEDIMYALLDTPLSRAVLNLDHYERSKVERALEELLQRHQGRKDEK